MPKMIDLITFLDSNGKLAVYTGGNINGLYLYLGMIGYPTTSTTSGHRYHHLGPLYSTNNDTYNLQTVIASICVWKNIVCELCEIIVHKDDDCIIFGPNFLPPSLRRNMNQFNAFHSDRKTDPPREWDSQPPEAHFKYGNSPTKTSHVVSSIMERLNNHDIDKWLC